MNQDIQLELLVLLIEKDSRMTLSVSNRAYAMTTGNVFLSCNSQDLLHDDRRKAAYLGGDVEGEA